MHTKTMKPTKRTMKTMKAPKTKAPTIEARHSATILYTDTRGHVWVDTLTLAMELQVSPFSFSGMILPELDRFYGDRNKFRRVHGRRALWDFTLIDRWYRQRKSPRGGYKPLYIQKLIARGELAA